MSLFQFKWLRRLVRKNTGPIEESRAAYWKKKLSIVYAIIAWNAFGIVAYQIYHGKADWAKYHGIKSEEEEKMSPGHRWAKTFGMNNATVYRVKGFSVKKIENEENIKTEEIIKD